MVTAVLGWNLHESVWVTVLFCGHNPKTAKQLLAVERDFDNHPHGPFSDKWGWRIPKLENSWNKKKSMTRVGSGAKEVSRTAKFCSGGTIYSFSWCTYDPPWPTDCPKASNLFCELDRYTKPKVPGALCMIWHAANSTPPDPPQSLLDPDLTPWSLCDQSWPWRAHFHAFLTLTLINSLCDHKDPYQKRMLVHLLQQESFYRIVWFVDHYHY